MREIPRRGQKAIEKEKGRASGRSFHEEERPCPVPTRRRRDQSGASVLCPRRPRASTEGKRNMGATLSTPLDSTGRLRVWIYVYTHGGPFQQFGFRLISLLAMPLAYIRTRNAFISKSSRESARWPCLAQTRPARISGRHQRVIDESHPGQVVLSRNQLIRILQYWSAHINYPKQT